MYSSNRQVCDGVYSPTHYVAFSPCVAFSHPIVFYVSYFYGGDLFITPQCTTKTVPNFQNMYAIAYIINEKSADFGISAEGKKKHSITEVTLCKQTHIMFHVFKIRLALRQGVHGNPGDTVLTTVQLHHQVFQTEAKLGKLHKIQKARIPMCRFMGRTLSKVFTPIIQIRISLHVFFG